METNECFIVMPFGVKAFPDGSGRTYDFDKVYRVLIQRAVREAGMKPIRADERVSSALIHTDMFRDLRDRRVVLADLSLDNPNVFYELGIRHVMSSNGTVLMCRKGSALPFDVKLSRVIFYDFDGASLDWEEVERVLKHLKVALQEARKGLPDSPVHALLEYVLREEDGAPRGQWAQGFAESAADGKPLEKYQKLLAECWIEKGASVADLFGEYRDSIFGSRALAYLCLIKEPLTEVAKQLANQLNDGQQYQLANKLYSKLYEAGKLTRGSLLAYASSYSEAKPDLAGADHAIVIVQEALKNVDQQFEQNLECREATAAYAECHRRLAGLRQWRWQLSRQAEDLERAVTAFSEAIRYNDRARVIGLLKHPGFLAQSRLKQLVLLRIRDQNVERPDQEGHRDAILALNPKPRDDPKGLSYLGWFQAITMADMGASEQAQRKALKTFANDAKLKTDPQHWEIGRRQYVQLRRFLEQYSPHLRNPSLIGMISQILQASDLNR